jgi:chemotaxis protein MotA
VAPDRNHHHRGAALGALLTSNPIKVVKAAFAEAVGLIKPSRYQREDYVDLLKLLYDILVNVRKEGMMSIEADLEKPEASALFTRYYDPRVFGTILAAAAELNK